MVCKIIGGLAALILTLTTIASLVGVYRTHLLPGGLTFGSLEGSVALAVLVLSLIAWVKTVHKMCPCGCATGCGCGAMCSGCGKPSADCGCGNSR